MTEPMTLPSAQGTLRITLVRSTIGRPKDQELTVRSLGLRRLHHTVERPDTPSIRGMVSKVQHLVTIEEVAARSIEEPASQSGRTSRRRRAADQPPE